MGPSSPISVTGRTGAGVRSFLVGGEVGMMDMVEEKVSNYKRVRGGIMVGAQKFKSEEKEKIENNRVSGAIFEQKNTLEFRPNKVLSDFNEEFLDEEKCRKYLLKLFYPDGAKCPVCGESVPEKSWQRFWENKKMKCPKCGKFYYATSKTVLSAKKLSLRQIYLIALLLGLGINPIRIAAIVGCDKKIIYYWRNYFNGIEQKLNLEG